MATLVTTVRHQPATHHSPPHTNRRLTGSALHHNHKRLMHGPPCPYAELRHTRGDMVSVDGGRNCATNKGYAWPKVRNSRHLKHSAWLSNELLIIPPNWGDNVAFWWQYCSYTPAQCTHTFVCELLWCFGDIHHAQNSMEVVNDSLFRNAFRIATGGRTYSIIERDTKWT